MLSKRTVVVASAIHVGPCVARVERRIVVTCALQLIHGGTGDNVKPVQARRIRAIVKTRGMALPAADVGLRNLSATGLALQHPLDKLLIDLSGNILPDDKTVQRVTSAE